MSDLSSYHDAAIVVLALESAGGPGALRISASLRDRFGWQQILPRVPGCVRVGEIIVGPPGSPVQGEPARVVAIRRSQLHRGLLFLDVVDPFLPPSSGFDHRLPVRDGVEDRVFVVCGSPLAGSNDVVFPPVPS